MYFIHIIDHNEIGHNSNVTKSNLIQQQQQQHDQINNIELQQIFEKNTNDEISSCSQSTSNNMKWYVSELRINRPLIYQTQCTIEQQNTCHRKFSHSVNDLKHFYNIINCQEFSKNRVRTKKFYNTAHSTLSLQTFNNQQQTYCYHSDDNILLDKNLSCTDDDLNNLSNDEDNHEDQSLSRKFLFY